MTTKKIVLPLAVAVLTMGTLFVTPEAHAQGFGGGGGNFFSGLIQFISQKFGLDKTQVQNAVNEYHQQNKANLTPRPSRSPEEIQASEQKRLDALVQQGKITSDQEKAILAELSSIRSKYNPDSLKNLTPQERRTKMQGIRDELVAWAKSQGIDSSYVLPGFGMGRPGMMGKRGHWNFGGSTSSTSATPTPAQ
jgi:transposase-like protein